jgi:hypothetical protein
MLSWIDAHPMLTLMTVTITGIILLFIDMLWKGGMFVFWNSTAEPPPPPKLQTQEIKIQYVNKTGLDEAELISSLRHELKYTQDRLNKARNNWAKSTDASMQWVDRIGYETDENRRIQITEDYKDRAYDVIKNLGKADKALWK